MRTTTYLAALATSALIGLGASAAPASAAAPTTEKQRGVVITCTGSAQGLSVYVDLYENDKHGNVVQVILNDNPDTAKSRELAQPFLNDGVVKTGITINAKRVSISGTAERVGPKRHVHEVIEDGGEHIVSDGFHRHLANDLVLKYGQKTVPLDCAPAFYYDLTVTREPIEG
ncbi:hypothetical protein [Nocardioides sp.]|uniref:hypothetical protein n=1 Tax=Nocardioides sp. TaxID=35761 RepID=UPI0031FF2D67|nr:hypothetical protein [Nocardioides sp.]